MQWNSHGYDIAKWFTHKFTHISPVWLQAKLNDDESDIVIEGGHDIDYGWMRELRQNNPEIKIGKLCLYEVCYIHCFCSVPRIIFERWTHSQYASLLVRNNLIKSIGKSLINFAKVFCVFFDNFTELLFVRNMILMVMLLKYGEFTTFKIECK